MKYDCIMSNRDLSMSENNIIPLKEKSIKVPDPSIHLTPLII
jgi:hypothetical protein